jgi:hypothetical protein
VAFPRYREARVAGEPDGETDTVDSSAGMDLNDFSFIQSLDDLDSLIVSSPVFRPRGFAPSSNLWTLSMEFLPGEILFPSPVPFVADLGERLYHSPTTAVYVIPSTTRVIVYHKHCESDRTPIDTIASEYAIIHFLASSASSRHIVPEPAFISDVLNPNRSLMDRHRVTRRQGVSGKIRHLFCPVQSARVVEAQIRYIIMERFGESLANMLSERKKFSIRDTMRVSIQILSALETLHHNNIVHGKIELGNVLYDSTEDRVKLIDFKRSRFVTENLAKPVSVACEHRETIPYIRFMNNEYSATPWSVYYCPLLPRDDIHQLIQLVAVLLRGDALIDSFISWLGARTTGSEKNRAADTNHDRRLLRLLHRKRRGSIFEESVVGVFWSGGSMKGILDNLDQLVGELRPKDEIPYKQIQAMFIALMDEESD